MTMLLLDGQDIQFFSILIDSLTEVLPSTFSSNALKRDIDLSINFILQFYIFNNKLNFVLCLKYSCLKSFRHWFTELISSLIIFPNWRISCLSLFIVFMLWFISSFIVFTSERVDNNFLVIPISVWFTFLYCFL